MLSHYQYIYTNFLFLYSYSGGLRLNSLIKETWITAMAGQQALSLWQEATRPFPFKNKQARLQRKFSSVASLGSSGTSEQGLRGLLSPGPRDENTLRAFCSILPCSGQLPIYRIKISPEFSSFSPLHWRHLFVQ